MSANNCPTCTSQDAVRLTTYKRYWNVCRECGTGWPEQREKYPFSFLRHADLKKNAESADGMYDYFTTEVHQEHASQEAADFYDRYLRERNLDLTGKSFLDVSGGNGFFVRWFAEQFGGRASLTEYNQPTVEFARTAHDFDMSVRYDMNSENLPEIVGRQFEVVIAKACLMFAADATEFAKQLYETVAPGGLLILGHSVEPTFGTMLRVQMDEFSYFALRQPDQVEKTFTEAGFEVEYRTDETDPTLYVYDHDLLPHWRHLRMFYDWKNSDVLAAERMYALPARDRRRSTILFRKA